MDRRKFIFTAATVGLGLLEASTPASAALLTPKGETQTPIPSAQLSKNVKSPTEIGFCNFSVATAITMGLTETTPTTQVILKKRLN